MNSPSCRTTSSGRSRSGVEQQQERSAAELMGLQPGTAVKVTAGPLAGLDALVRMTAQDRVVVLLQLLGKDHEVAIPYQALACA